VSLRKGVLEKNEMPASNLEIAVEGG
jgi:hypothetical protein